MTYLLRLMSDYLQQKETLLYTMLADGYKDLLIIYRRKSFGIHLS